MSWKDYTDNLTQRKFCGATIIDRSSYAVLAEANECIPRGYKVDGVDVNENTYLAANWNTPDFTSIRYNQVKYMILRKGDNEFFGKKGDKSIFGYKLNAIFLIGVNDSNDQAMEQAQVGIGAIYDSLKQANM